MELNRFEQLLYLFICYNLIHKNTLKNQPKMSRTKNLPTLIATFLCLLFVSINGEIKNWEKDMTNEVYIEASHEGFEEVIVIIFFSLFLYYKQR